MWKHGASSKKSKGSECKSSKKAYSWGFKVNMHHYYMVNPCALIGSFLVKILQYGPFPWKRVNPCIFVLERRQQIQNLQPKQRKKICEYCHSSLWNYQKKLKRLKFCDISKADEEDEHSPSKFYYPEDLEIFDGETETGFTECHVINNLSLLGPYWGILICTARSSAHGFWVFKVFANWSLFPRRPYHVPLYKD